MSRKKTPVTNIGTSLILVVFIILALVTFATLSVVTANRDYQYTKKIADRTTAYYQASNQAQQQLRDMDALLKSSYDTEPVDYFTTACEALATIDSLEIHTDETVTAPTVAFTYKINDTSSLHVMLTLTTPDGTAGSFYKIDTWQEISTKKWDADNSIKLINE